MAIKQLDAFDHIRLRPGMYIGSTENPTHLLYELIDNAADECINGFSKAMYVVVNHDKKHYAVIDHGHGIPIKNEDIKDDIPYVLCTTLFSGGKFDNELYTHRAGLHGVGLVAVNALSDEMVIKTKYDKDKSIEYKMHGTAFTKEVIDKLPYSTYVGFTPSENIFTSTDIDVSSIVNKMKFILIHTPDIDMNIIEIKNGEKVLVPISNDYLQGFFNKCTHKIDEPIQLKCGKDLATLYLGFNDSISSRYFSSSVNTIDVKSGTHQSIIESTLREFIQQRIESKKVYAKKEDAMVGSRTFCILNVCNPAFGGQVKHSLDMKPDELRDLLDKRKITKYLENNIEFVDKWIEYTEQYRVGLDSKRKVKKNNGNKSVNVEGLRDCTSKELDERELFILEGRSAGGTLLQCRDPKRHAMLPLTGKIANTITANKAKILSNKVISNIFKSINVAPYSDDISGARYGKIVISCDADRHCLPCQ